MADPRHDDAARIVADALQAATQAVNQSIGRRAVSGHAPSPAVLREETWQLIHLFGALGELAAVLAPQVGGYAEHYRLHADDHADAADHIARACRQIAALRQALDRAERAAREVYTAVSHLHTVPEGAGRTSSTTDVRGAEE
jgi:hypothetical protein